MLRVFRRLASLRRIINALSSSVLPMLNAFTVLFLITAIYAILAVKMYRQQVLARGISPVTVTRCSDPSWAALICPMMVP